MLAAEHGLLAFYCLRVSALVDFAAAMSTDVQARLNRRGDKSCEAFEESSAKLSSFICEFVDFPWLLSYRLHSVFYKSLLFEKIEERIDDAGSDVSIQPLPELG